MKLTFKHYGLVFYRAGHSLAQNYGFEMAGYLTFLALLSLFPYLVLMISAAGAVGQGGTGRELISILLQHLPPDTVATISPRIQEIINGPPHSILTFSILGAIWTSSSTVEAIRGMLNRAYHVHKPPAYLRRRLTSIGQIILLTLLILGGMVLFVFVPIAVTSLSHFTGLAMPLTLAHFFSFFFKPIAALALFGIVASFYHVLPNIKQSWGAVMPGAGLVVVLLFAFGSLIGFYLNDISHVTVVYGSLSGFIATLLSFYFMGLIFIYGAEFNHALLVIQGKRIVEKEMPAGETLH